MSKPVLWIVIPCYNEERKKLPLSGELASHSDD